MYLTSNTNPLNTTLLFSILCNALNISDDRMTAVSVSHHHVTCQNLTFERSLWQLRDYSYVLNMIILPPRSDAYNEPSAPQAFIRLGDFIGNFNNATYTILSQAGYHIQSDISTTFWINIYTKLKNSKTEFCSEVMELIQILCSSTTSPSDTNVKPSPSRPEPSDYKAVIIGVVIGCVGVFSHLSLEWYYCIL